MSDPEHPHSPVSAMNPPSQSRIMPLRSSCTTMKETMVRRIPNKSMTKLPANSTPMRIIISRKRPDWFDTRRAEIESEFLDAGDV